MAGSATSRRRTRSTPTSVVAEEYVPAHLANAVVRPEDFDEGQQLLQLSLAGERIWDDAWSKFTAGG